MAHKAYGQYCGLARALELIGDRWGLLVVRDLMIGPRRFGELAEGLAGITTSVLTQRLKELEATGLVRREPTTEGRRGLVYVLTPTGRALEPAMIELGRWGAHTLAEMRPGEIVTHDSVAMALRTMYHPEGAGDLTVVWDVVLGPYTYTVTINDGILEVGDGPAEKPDATLELGSHLKDLATGVLTPAAALERGLVTAPRRALQRFCRVFRLDPVPVA